MKRLLLLALLAGGLPLAHAQYAVPWSKIAGGGATTPSTGGVFAVSGTVGQHDASSALTGGGYSVTGGSWPLPATGFVLDQTTALASPPASIAWSQVSVATYQTNATHISITVPPGVGSQFYRLRKP